MDEKGREAYLKLLKMLVARDSKNQILNEEWNGHLEWYFKFKDWINCNVLGSNLCYWTSKGLTLKDRIWLTLRECLLSHRWKEALHTLIVLADNPVYTSTYTIPRVGMELIYQLGLNNELIEKLISSSKCTNHGLSKKELTLDAFLFSLVTNFSGGLDTSNASIQKFAELSDSLKERIHRTHNSRFFNSPNEQLNLVLFTDVYKGLASYAKWLSTKIELEGMQRDGSEEWTKLVEILTLQFKEATEHISRGAEEEGNWSSYISKMVEMVEYQADIEENKEFLLRAEVVLHIYLKKHPKDFSCLKMLHALYLRHQDVFSTEKRINVLRAIVLSCPFDPLALKLVKDEEKVTKKLRLLVAYLHGNKEDHNGWLMLVSILQKGLAAKTDKEVITKTLQSLISQRELHRTMFFFNPRWSSASDLVIVKACVACLLMGNKCGMYKGVRKLIRKMPYEPSFKSLFKSVKHSSYNIEI